MLTELPVVAVKSDAKWKTLKDLIADGKARPKAITVGNSGVGSHTHISSVALFRPAGVQAVDVPFAAAQVVPSLLGGQVDAVVQLPAALAQYVKSGQVRFLAAMVASRDPAFPDVPTAREQGFDVTLEAWRGIAVPVGTPAATVAALELAIRNTVASKEFVQACERLGARPAFLPSGQFGALIAKEDALLAKLMDVDRAEEVAAAPINRGSAGREATRAAPRPLIVALGEHEGIRRDDAVAAGLLGLVHRHVGAAQHRVDGVLLFPFGDAEAAGHAEGLLAVVEAQARGSSAAIRRQPPWRR